MWNVFEQPWTLLGLAVLVFFGVLTFRSVWPERQRWWQLALPIAIAAAALGLDYLVPTDLERINSLVKLGAKAVEEENCQAIEKIIAEDYSDSRHKSKGSLMAHCRSELSRPTIERAKRLDMAIELSPPEASVMLSLLVKFEKDSRIVQDYYRPYALVKARVHLKKDQSRRWLINQVEIVEVDKTPVNWGSAG